MMSGSSSSSSSLIFSGPIFPSSTALLPLSQVCSPFNVPRSPAFRHQRAARINVVATSSTSVPADHCRRPAISPSDWPRPHHPSQLDWAVPGSRLPADLDRSSTFVDAVPPTTSMILHSNTNVVAVGSRRETAASSSTAVAPSSVDPPRLPSSMCWLLGEDISVSGRCRQQQVGFTIDDILGRNNRSPLCNDQHCTPRTGDTNSAGVDTDSWKRVDKVDFSLSRSLDSDNCQLTVTTSNQRFAAQNRSQTNGHNRRRFTGYDEVLGNLAAARARCRTGKRVRTIFTQDQLDRLEKEFERQQYMVGTERFYLATELGLVESQVKVWFQNRRIKWRRQTADSQRQYRRLHATQFRGVYDNDDELYDEDDVNDDDDDDEDEYISRNHRNNNNNSSSSGDDLMTAAYASRRGADNVNVGLLLRGGGALPCDVSDRLRSMTSGCNSSATEVIDLRLVAAAGAAVSAAQIIR